MNNCSESNFKMQEKYYITIISFSKYVLSVYCVPSTIVGVGNIAVGKEGKNPTHVKLILLWKSIQILGFLDF